MHCLLILLFALMVLIVMCWLEVCFDMGVYVEMLLEYCVYDWVVLLLRVWLVIC